MDRIWLASRNPKKVAELRRLLAPLGYELESLSATRDAPEIPEDRPDFMGNAEVKAVTVARTVGAPAVGDDSGLCVDALDGRPGTWSARYAGPGATDADRVAKLLAELEGIPFERRTARFTCAVVLASSGGEVLARIEKHCEGVILEEPRGSGGFGYDPIFVARAHLDLPGPPSFAELAPADKDGVSHRGKALAELAAYLAEHRIA